ncbi:hypothetical protein LEP1GSC050_0081 [Leptospira phage vB_LbrZ_5399-LE1]|nr:hypothetical protein LEP1GSC050_0081 [Leptospira phage vB_LbrZ_5399-LE1]AGS80811.1 hypothetical protein LEP1GSC047_0890 [Leptospira phage vB_LinZ_10-LE1]
MNKVHKLPDSEEIKGLDEIERDLDTENRIKSLIKKEGVTKRIQISIKLDPILLSTIKNEALKRNIPYQSLVSMVLTDRFLTNNSEFGLIRNVVRDEFKTFGKSISSNLHSILQEELSAITNKRISKPKGSGTNSKGPKSTTSKRKVTGR